MTGVLLRCPNCGTSKTSPGECEACHEAQVRYYCTNHKPGRWLDASACPQCGAKFGDSVRPAARPVPPPAPARPRTTITSPEPERRADPPPPIPRTSADPWGRRERGRSPGPDVEVGDGRASARHIRTARMLEILRAASRAGRMSRGAAHTDREVPPVGAALGSCLMRFVLLVIFMIIILMLMLPLVGGALLQMLGGYEF
jgi:hypothetical protein